MKAADDDGAFPTLHQTTESSSDSEEDYKILLSRTHAHRGEGKETFLYPPHTLILTPSINFHKEKESFCQMFLSLKKISFNFYSHVILAFNLTIQSSSQNKGKLSKTLFMHLKAKKALVHTLLNALPTGE